MTGIIRSHDPQMADALTSLLGPDEDPWNLSPDDPKRQAIASLRGYAYQLHRSLAAWIALPGDATLHLEIAEDYATVARDPTTLQTVLEATQVKATRESGSVTLNSPDVLAAVRNFWALRTANLGRAVRLVFLTTSPIGRERIDPLPNGEEGLNGWIRAARGGPVSDLRAALRRRLDPKAPHSGDDDAPPDDKGLAAFIADSDDETFRRELLLPVSWACGEPETAGVAADNRAALVILGQTLGGTPDLSARAADLLLVRVLSTILESSDRRLRRGDLLEALHAAVTVRVPAQRALNMPAAHAQGLDLEATGAWRLVSPSAPKTAPRAGAVANLRAAMAADGHAWVHGATGLGKSLLAELAANAMGGMWRLLDLRDATGGTARERLVAARGAILADPMIAGVIIDDIPPSLDREIENPLCELTRSLERRCLPLIATSNHPPGRRLERALGLNLDSIYPAPSFDRDDAAALVEAYGGDPARWAVFALFAGAAHPQLVDVVIAGLERRGWPETAMNEWMSAGMRNEDVEAEREVTRRRLLGELAPNVLAILARTVRIYGTFDRELVQAVGAAAPAVAATGLSLDQLSGQWIERLTSVRMRTSPLVSGLDRETYDAAQLAVIDIAIVVHILTRKQVDADLLDTAFFHAWAAESEAWISWIAQYVLQVDEEERPKLASALPLLREADGPTGFLRPFPALLLQLARHLLRTAIGDDAEVARSANTLIGALDELVDDTVEAGPPAVLIVLMKLLFDVFGHGRVPNWFAHIRRFASTVGDNVDLRKVIDEAGLSVGSDPSGYLFVAHAVKLPGITALEGLFDELASLPAGERAIWLAAMHEPSAAMSMIIDNAWLKETQRGTVDGTTQAAAFDRMAVLALEWGEPRLAGRCWRAQAVMLDEYARAPEAAYAALDAAEQRLPGNFDIARERAKVAWRANDYPTALEQLLALESRLHETEPFDAAFALREAAISASELGQWSEAARLYSGGRDFVIGDDGDVLAPLAVGLAADAAAAQFRSGQRAEAVRAMAAVLDMLAALDPDSKLTAQSVHLIVRHLILWMRSEEVDIEVHGEAVHFPIGGASNPDPKKAMATLSITPLAPAWQMLARIALDAGIEAAEVLGWPGLTAARTDPIIDALFRSELLRFAIERADLPLFRSALLPALEAYQLFARLQSTGETPDPLRTNIGVIDPLPPDALVSGAPRSATREAAIAFALVDCARDPPLPSRIPALHGVLASVTRVDVLPEWSEAPTFDETDRSSIVASNLVALSGGASLPPQQSFMAHLRMLEWVRGSNYVKEVQGPLEALVRLTWTRIAVNQRALLLTPSLTVPAIEGALASGLSGVAFVAHLLLTAEPAVSLNLSNEFREQLEEIRNG